MWAALFGGLFGTLASIIGNFFKPALENVFKF